MKYLLFALMLLCPTLAWAGSNSVVNWGQTSIPTCSTPPNAGQAVINNGTCLTGGNVAGGGVTVPTEAGNDAYYPSTAASVSGVAHTIHAGTGTLTAAFAACPTTSNIPCIVHADPGQTYTLSSQLNIGVVSGSKYPQTLSVDGAKISITNTNSAQAGIALYDQGKIECHTYDQGATGSTGSIISEAGTANVVAAVANEGAINSATDTHMNIEGCQISGGGTNSKAVLYISGVDGLANLSNDRVSGCGASNCVQIDDAAGQNNVVNISGMWVSPGASATGRGINIRATSRGMGPISCENCSVVDFTGSVPMVDVEASGSGAIRAVNMPGLYLENFSTFTGDSLFISSVNGFNAPGMLIDHNSLSGTPTNCVHIASGSNIHVNGWSTLGNCTNLIKNDDTGYTNSATSGVFSYNYSQTSASGSGDVFDGKTPTLSGAGITSGTIPTGSLATVQGNGTKVQLGTGTLTSGHCLQADANANVVDSGIVGCGGSGASAFVQAMTAGTALSLYGGL